MKARNVLFILIAISTIFTVAASGQDHSNIELIAQKPIGSWRWILDIESLGDYAFLACGGLGLQIIDPHRPESSNCIGILKRDDLHFSSLDVNNDYIIAQSRQDAVIVDISDPTAPQIISSIDSVAQFDANGDLLHAIFDKYRIYSIENPAEPFLIAQLEDIGNLVSICASGELVCIADHEDNIQVYTVVDPENPTRVETIEAVSPHKMKIFNDFLCFITLENQHWNVFNVSDPDSIYRIADYPLPDGSYDYHLFEDKMALIAGTGLAYVFDISDISRPRRIGAAVQLDLWGWVPSIHYTNDRILVGQYGLHVIDASNLESISFLTYEIGVYRMEHMQLQNGLLFAGYVDGGLRIYDVENVNQIIEVAHIPIQTGIDGLSFDDAGNLYIMEEDIDSILVFDISDVENWQQIGGLNLDAYDLYISGDTAIAAVWGEDPVAIDISDPTNLRIISERRRTNRDTYDIEVLGNYAYTACWSGLYVFDISDITHPREIGRIQTSENPLRICGRSDYIVGAQGYSAWWDGIYLFNCYDPSNPIRMWGTLSDGDPEDVINAPEGNIVFTAEGETGIRCFHITGDYRLWERGFYDTPGNAICLAADEERLFVGDITYIQVLDCSEAFNTVSEQSIPREFTLFKAYPNPFNTTTTIRFGLDKSAPARLAIYDPRGRLVDELMSGERLMAGEHRAIWDANGLPAGIYLCRLAIEGETITQKLTLVK